MTTARPPVLVAKYTPQAKAAGLGRRVAYYSWREGEDRPREHPRVWHAHGGRELDYAAARAEIAAAARRAGAELDWDVLARRYETDVLDRYLS